MRKKDTVSPAGTFAGPEEAVVFSRAKNAVHALSGSIRQLL